MKNPSLALIFIRRFSDFFREPLDQLSIFFGGNAASSNSGRAPGATGHRRLPLHVRKVPHGQRLAVR